MNCCLRSLLVACVGVFLLAADAAATTKWICSVVEGIECSDGVGCGPPDFGPLEAPTFLHVDTQKRIITLLAPASRRGETTQIGQAVETSEGWILAGVEDKRAWSMMLTNEGYMTVTVTMDGTAWTAFGRCIPEGSTAP